MARTRRIGSPGREVLQGGDVPEDRYQVSEELSEELAGTRNFIRLPNVAVVCFSDFGIPSSGNAFALPAVLNGPLTDIVDNGGSD
ncbi:MAG: hypothetical protein HY319_32735 [Armatimonadetes bacterium]|nr:hypothetical protein [Armatimonadota bacterium]